MIRELHLFAGAGGGILGGMLLGHVPVCAVEIDPYCQDVLRARQADGSLPAFPIFDDVRTFNGHPWRGKVDVVCGGFPCQPWSSAGKRLGTNDPRHLWPAMARIVGEVRPRFVFAENVSLEAMREPWRDLRGMGYRVPPALCLGADDVGAPHRRKRWWLLAADAYGARMRQQHDLEHVSGAERTATGTRHDGSQESVANADGARLEGRDSAVVSQRAGQRASGPGCALGHANGERQLQQGGSIPDIGGWVGNSGWWQTEPNVGRVAHGVAKRLDRLRALGNGQVPQTAAIAFSILRQRLEHTP